MEYNKIVDILLLLIYFTWVAMGKSKKWKMDRQRV